MNTNGTTVEESRTMDAICRMSQDVSELTELLKQRYREEINDPEMKKRHRLQRLAGREADMLVELFNLLEANFPNHTHVEVIDGFSTGNVWVGMTEEDYEKFADIMQYFHDILK